MAPESILSFTKCALMIGATSGIGLDLALALHSQSPDRKVIISGRRQDRLDAICREASSERLVGRPLDINGGKASLKQFVSAVVQDYPELDCVVLCAGIQHRINFVTADTENILDKLEAELNTNYTSFLLLLTLFMPHFLRRNKTDAGSAFMVITSGLAIIPGAAVPGYCATKAALHSLCMSLRTQLRTTKIRVIEIIPPLVESELHDHQGTRGQLSKFWMPLSEFTTEVMEELASGKDEIPIGSSEKAFEKYEKGKQEMVDGRYRP